MFMVVLMYCGDRSIEEAFQALTARLQKDAKSVDHKGSIFTNDYTGNLRPYFVCALHSRSCFRLVALEGKTPLTL